MRRISTVVCQLSSLPGTTTTDDTSADPRFQVSAPDETNYSYYAIKVASQWDSRIISLIRTGPVYPTRICTSYAAPPIRRLCLFPNSSLFSRTELSHCRMFAWCLRLVSSQTNPFCSICYNTKSWIREEFVVGCSHSLVDTGRVSWAKLMHFTIVWVVLFST